MISAIAPVEPTLTKDSGGSDGSQVFTPLDEEDPLVLSP